jgi:hypothetical protein
MAIKPAGNRSLEISRRKLEDNFKMEVTDPSGKNEIWMTLAQIHVQSATLKRRFLLPQR